MNDDDAKGESREAIEAQRHMGETVLLPCPFCGFYAELGHSDDDDRWFVCCQRWRKSNHLDPLYPCGIVMDADTEQQAIAAWNRRS